MVNKIKEAYGVLRKLESTADTTDLIVITHRRNLYQVIEIADSPSDFACCKDVKGEWLVLAIMQVWTIYKVVELLKHEWI